MQRKYDNALIYALHTLNKQLNHFSTIFKRLTQRQITQTNINQHYKHIINILNLPLHKIKQNKLF